MMMSSISRNTTTDLHNTQSTSSSSSSSSSSFNYNNNKLNSCGFQMSVDGFHNKHPTTTDTTTQQQTTTATPSLSNGIGNGNGKSVDDVWKDILHNKTTTIAACKQEEEEEDHQMMTLEDFLANQAGPSSSTTLLDDDVKIPLSNAGGSRMFSFDNHTNLDPTATSPSLLLLDKAAQQRQKRMIKNRESAARSRERKQAYQTQLESLLLKLRQDNHTLSIAKTQQSRTRYKQLMDNIIPVTEKRRPPTRHLLRKVRSMEW